MTRHGHAEQQQLEPATHVHQRPRREDAPSYRVAADGRLGVLNAKGALALQRRVGNAAVGALLGRHAGPRPVVQTYIPTTTGGRMSENRDIFKRGDHELFATEALVNAANVQLQRPDASHIGLGVTDVKAYTNGKTYGKVSPAYHHHPGDAGNDKLDTLNPSGSTNLMNLWADCGKSSRVVMGTKSGKAPHARWREGTTSAAYQPSTYSDEIYPKMMRKFLDDAKDKSYLVANVHYTGNPRVLKYPATADEARAQYQALPEDVRRHLDKWAHINSGANPDIGGGYTMNTEYNMPGSGAVPGHMRWNFHWAGVILKDGADNVTLENYAVGDPKVANQDWNFEMYGTVKKGQTFHDQHLASNTHGTRASSFEVEPTP